MVRLMFEALEGAGRLDGFLVAPHGANAGEGEDYRDLDGFWLSKLRDRIGTAIPIICTIDPHANLSGRMVAACDATIAYRSNPHLDQKERGLEAANLMVRTLRGEIKPVQRASMPAFGINIERQGTTLWPCLPLYELANKQLAQAGVLCNTTGFVCLYDREAQERARAAGVGARLTLSMGGKTDARHGDPLVAEVEVCSLHEGKFEESEVRHGGMTHFDMGPTTVVKTVSGLTISLTTLRVVPVSLGVLTSIGLEPDEFQIIVAKGVHAPVAAYEPVCTKLIRVNTKGASAADMRTFEYQYRRRPLYPFEEIASGT